MIAAKCYVLAICFVFIGASNLRPREYADYEGTSDDIETEDGADRDFYEALERSNELDDSKLWNSPIQRPMVRKSQRSPSLRLRFGRRSDPRFTNELVNGFTEDTKTEKKSARSPTFRLRFGRRSEPDLVEYIARKVARSPSLRLRFGRRSDPLSSITDPSYALEDYEDYAEKRSNSAPTFRLRFGRRSESLDSVNDVPDTEMETN